METIYAEEAEVRYGKDDVSFNTFKLGAKVIHRSEDVLIEDTVIEIRFMERLHETRLEIDFEESGTLIFVGYKFKIKQLRNDGRNVQVRQRNITTD